FAGTGRGNERTLRIFSVMLYGVSVHENLAKVGRFLGIKQPKTSLESGVWSPERLECGVCGLGSLSDTLRTRDCTLNLAPQTPDSARQTSRLQNLRSALHMTKHDVKNDEDHNCRKTTTTPHPSPCS